MNCVMLNSIWESLHAFYFYVKQFSCLRWDGPVPLYQLSSFDTRISLVNIVTQKM